MAEYIGERKKGTYDISLKSLLEKQLLFKQTYLSISQEGSFSEEQMLLEKMYLYLSKQTQNIYNVQQIFNNYYTQEVSFRDEKSFRPLCQRGQLLHQALGRPLFFPVLLLPACPSPCHRYRHWLPDRERL